MFARSVACVCLIWPSMVWAESKPLASTVQLPTFGVSIDAQGELRLRRVDDQNGELAAERRAAANRIFPADLRKTSPLRKISLRAVERALRTVRDLGQPADESLRALAGLQRIEFLFCDPDRGDIVIAGPAEAWFVDEFGRRLGLITGRPVILLDDLLVALRSFQPTAPPAEFVGCTIDPTPDGLANHRRFQRTIPSVVADADQALVAEQVAEGTYRSLGAAHIRVFGVPANTHLAQVMVEAGTPNTRMCAAPRLRYVPSATCSATSA